MGELEAYIEAHSRYQGYRDAAFHLTWEVWNNRLGPEMDLKIFPPYSVEANALRFWELLWTAFDKPTVTYKWDKIFGQILRTPRRLDAAIWSGPILCGLVAGMASRGNNVTIRFLERWPGDINPLRGRIAPIALDIADYYAKILGKQWVMIKDPEPKAVEIYENRLGFSFYRSIKGRKFWRRYVE